MTSSGAQRIVLAARPRGKPTLDDFRLEEIAMPAMPPGGVLLRTLAFSLDPYMRGRMDDRKSYAPSVAIGAVMIAEVVARVMASDTPAYREGDIVLADTGWCTHAGMVPTAKTRKLDASVAPVTTALGVLGMPGFTAWSGLKLIGRPAPGETVVVAAASGPVGSLVGQLARLWGCRAVGIAGGAKKCAHLMEVLGFDAAVDHRDPNMAAHLAAACPKGVDVYFENVGGAVWQAVQPLLAPFARVPVCGLIAQYSGAGESGSGRFAAMMRDVLTKSLTLRGFINSEFYAEHLPAFLDEVSAGVADGRIRYVEDVTDGLANAPAAFLDMLEGRNFGKTLIRVGE